jgi:hypothetical protein
MEYATFKEYAVEKKPKFVLMCFFGGNDFQDYRVAKERMPFLEEYIEGSLDQGNQLL